MKTDRNIFIAFILNLGFSIFEFIGGAFTNSVAITSDAVHDMGDAASIGISFFLEKKSHRKADKKHSFGYARYSLLGSMITTGVLAAGSTLMIVESIKRIANPVPVDYKSMIWLAIFGFIVNLAASFATREGDSLNQKSVNLHMMEDVLGWLVVLIGAVVMNFTDFTIIDSAMSIGIAVTIFISAAKTFNEALDIILDNTPTGFSISEVHDRVAAIDGVKDVHHIHIWSADGQKNYATLHVVAKEKPMKIKKAVKGVLADYGIAHTTVEVEEPGEKCCEESCDKL